MRTDQRAALSLVVLLALVGLAGAWGGWTTWTACGVAALLAARIAWSGRLDARGRDALALGLLVAVAAFAALVVGGIAQMVAR